MKKRQKPFLLITLLVIAGGGVAFMSKLADNGQNPAAEQNQQQQPTLGQSQDAKESGKDLASGVASQMKGAKPGMPHMPMMKGGMLDGPTIKKFKQMPYKPVPNDSSVSSQWYTPESMKGGQ